MIRERILFVLWVLLLAAIMWGGLLAFVDTADDLGHALIKLWRMYH